MKHLKLFENFKDIKSICEKYGITNYTINPDGTIDVDGNVNLSNKKLKRLPLKFGKVTGYFDCSNNNLKILEGCPIYVGGDFYCYRNKLTTLVGGPKYVGIFDCSYNKLTSLEGCPIYVGGDFDCTDNDLTSLISLKDVLIEVSGCFFCGGNQLISLEGLPIKVGNVYCGYNRISFIYDLFEDYKEYLDSLDYNYLRGTDIIKSRFKEALQEIGKEMPEKITGYNYI